MSIISPFISNKNQINRSNFLINSN